MNKINCIIVKILNIGIILMSVIYTPFQFYYCGMEFRWSSLIVLVLLSIFFFSLGWFGLLKTNNPLSRYNPFTFNPRWKSKMDYSMDENPGQLYQLDDPTPDEILREKRNKKLNQLLK